MKKEKKIEKLSDWEHTLLWSSMRYFMGRQTIASATWPGDFMKNMYKRLVEHQIFMMHKDLKELFEQNGKFGSETIDSPVWERLMHFLSKERYLVTAEAPKVKRQTVECFKHKEIYYAVDKFGGTSSESYIYEPYIKHIEKIGFE